MFKAKIEQLGRADRSELNRLLFDYKGIKLLN